MIKQFFKKVLISYLIIICCVVTPTYRAYAVSAGGWAFSSFDVAKNLVTAMKNGAAASVAVAKSPIVSKIGKGIVGGAIAGAAIPLAISQLTGIALSAVDWVLDPANNQIKYRYKPGYSDMVCSGNPAYVTPELAFRAFLSARGISNYSGLSCKHISDSQDLTVYECSANTNDVITTVSINCSASTPAPETPFNTIPIPTVANKIYDNAKTDSNSRSIVNDAVKDYVNSGAADVALDNAKADADASHACGTGTHWSGSACVADTPNTPTTPDVPFDPSSILDAIASLFDAVMSLPDVINSALDDLFNNIKDLFQPLIDALKSLIEKLTEFFDAIIAKFDDFVDWVKTTYDEFVKPADDEPTELDIPNNLPTPTDTNIRFGGMCPPNAEINVRIPFATINATLFDWSKWCYNLDTFVKPVIILLAAYFSVLIFRGKNESS